METRKHIRHKLSGILDLGEKQFNLLDVSVEGCSIFSGGHELTLNQAYEAKLILGATNIRVNVVFIRKKDDKRYGAEFVFIDKGSRQHLQNYLLGNRDRIR